MNQFNVDDPESIPMSVTDYKSARKKLVADELNQVAWHLRGALDSGVKIKISLDPRTSEPSLYFLDEPSNTALRIPGKRNQILGDHFESYWGMQAQIESLKEQIRERDQDIKSLKVQLDLDGEVL